MPYKRKSTKKKSFKKRARKATTTFRKGTTLGVGIPRTLSSTLKYSQTIALSSSAGSTPDYVWSLNGLHTPSTTGGSGSHQPMYFDQLIALYNHYTVIGAKITVTLTSGSAATVPFRAVLSMDDDGIIGGNIDTLTEYSKSKSLIRTVTGNSPQKIRMNWSAKKTFKGSVMGNNLLRGNSSSNPSEQSYAALTILPVDGVSSVTVYATVLIEYITVFTELKDIGGS